MADGARAARRVRFACQESVDSAVTGLAGWSTHGCGRERTRGPRAPGTRPGSSRRWHTWATVPTTDGRGARRPRGGRPRLDRSWRRPCCRRSQWLHCAGCRSVERPSQQPTGASGSCAGNALSPRRRRKQSVASCLHGRIHYWPRKGP